MAFEPQSFFGDHFIRLTSREPYPWQRKLFLRFIAPPTDPWPEVIDLPTGAGKTSVLYVWLLALAWSVQTRTFSVPRRLAWIVNRRVVVDQVTSEVEEIVERLQAGDSENQLLRELLASVSLGGIALGASTLRGQFADNGDWSRDPSSPSVVIGTVDMIGSRLLFRGYRASGYYRPIHAGLLGVDTFIVNDEAHLSPALARLLARLGEQRPAGALPNKSFRILLLSATPGFSDELRRFEHDPAEDAAQSKTFSAVFHAPKSLTLRQVGNLNELDAAVWSLATECRIGRTAVFIEQPEKAAKFAERLRKEKRPCALLTGTMRGYERDRLFTDDVFKRFLAREAGTDPVWLVCTSAGEVGINFSCERMLTGLVEADHLLQRFGRLNRFGNTVAGEAYVIFRAPSDKEVRLKATAEYLRGLDGDISCANVWANRPPAGACSEPPVLARLEKRHIEMWAQTSYHDRFLPKIASWLHGQQEVEAPDTDLAWRSDVDILTQWNVAPERIQEVVEYYPVLAHERLKEPASRVAKKLEEIQERIGIEAAAKIKLIVIESDATASICDLVYLVKLSKKDDSYLGYKLLLLPHELGSVVAGMFSSAESPERVETLDVADLARDDGHPVRTRFLFRGDESIQRMPTRENAEAAPAPSSTSREDLFQYEAKRYRTPLVVENPEEEESFLVYFAARSARPRQSQDVHLAGHLEAVGAKAKALAECVGLQELADDFEFAGKIHDKGKHRPNWQRAMGGSMEHPIAKSKAPVNLRLIDRYRHELGSIIDALSGGEESMDDLVLHLVASHHSSARPFFETRQFDPLNLRRSAQQSIEIARRYSRLQARYGPWGLAYLEAVFKCADGLVSAEEGEPASA